jgi:hypothetical protein
VRTPRAEVTYVHFMLDRHEIVFAEGAETESLDPAGDLAGAEREIARLFPALLMSRAAGPVRPAVRAFEAQAMAY